MKEDEVINFGNTVTASKKKPELTFILERIGVNEFSLESPNIDIKGTEEMFINDKWTIRIGLEEVIENLGYVNKQRTNINETM